MTGDGIEIDDAELEAKINELAKRLNVSAEEAVHVAVSNQLERDGIDKLNDNSF